MTATCMMRIVMSWVLTPAMWVNIGENRLLPLADAIMRPLPNNISGWWRVQNGHRMERKGLYVQLQATAL